MEIKPIGIVNLISKIDKKYYKYYPSRDPFPEEDVNDSGIWLSVYSQETIDRLRKDNEELREKESLLLQYLNERIRFYDSTKLPNKDRSYNHDIIVIYQNIQSMILTNKITNHLWKNMTGSPDQKGGE